MSELKKLIALELANLMVMLVIVTHNEIKVCKFWSAVLDKLIDSLDKDEVTPEFAHGVCFASEMYAREMMGKNIERGDGGENSEID